MFLVLLDIIWSIHTAHIYTRDIFIVLLDIIWSIHTVHIYTRDMFLVLLVRSRYEDMFIHLPLSEIYLILLDIGRGGPALVGV
jgi:hypothetical protein